MYRLSEYLVQFWQVFKWLGLKKIDSDSIPAQKEEKMMLEEKEGVVFREE